LTAASIDRTWLFPEHGDLFRLLQVNLGAIQREFDYLLSALGQTGKRGRYGHN
jgi:hypothetical protein